MSIRRVGNVESLARTEDKGNSVWLKGGRESQELWIHIISVQEATQGGSFLIKYAWVPEHQSLNYHWIALCIVFCLSVFQIHFHYSTMSSYNQLCRQPWPICCEPCVGAWNEPCIKSCDDSRAVVYPPPVVVTFPGPILSSCPQESVVGSSAPVLFRGLRGYEGPCGYRGSFLYNGSQENKFSYPYCFQKCSSYRFKRYKPCQTKQDDTPTKDGQDAKKKIQAQE